MYRSTSLRGALAIGLSTWGHQGHEVAPLRDPIRFPRDMKKGETRAVDFLKSSFHTRHGLNVSCTRESIGRFMVKREET